MNNKNKFLSDEFLNKAIKVLVVILLTLGVVILAGQFDKIWSTIISAFSAVIVPFALVWLLSLIMFPLIKLLERRGVGPRFISVVVVFAATIAVFVLIVYFLIPYILAEVRNFFETDWIQIQAYFANDFRNEFLFGTDIYDWILQTANDSNLFEETIAGVVDGLTNVISNGLINFISVVVVLPVSLIYYLKDYELINDSLRSIIPKRYEKDASELGFRLNSTVGAYIRGQLLLMLAIGIVATLAYSVIGLQYFFIFGLIVGLTNIIPYFGAIIAMIPVGIYAVIVGDDGPGLLLVLAVNVILQFIEGNFFQPIIMGRQLEMHPLIIIVSILFFGTLFGTFGVVFAAPIAATIRVLIGFYREKRAKTEELTVRS